MRVTWEVDDGYVGGKRPQHTEIPDDELAECGKGLHLSPTPFMALEFNNGKVLKCKVKKSHCKTVKNPTYPTKVRCKEVEVLEEVKNLILRRII